MALNTFFEQKITPSQKKATAILSIGTFLEAFDLYLYIHLAFILEKEFFPPGFSHNWVLANLALCSAFIFRPIGAIFFGWLGDLLGRKSVIFITTTITASVCLITSFLPSYSQLGPIAGYIILTCRIIQGIVCPCELQGARLYLAETVSGNFNRCFLSSIAAGVGIFGRFAAIGISNFVINLGHDSWRVPFIFGAVVALIGMYARASLKEADEFVEAKRRFIEDKKKNNSIVKSKFKSQDIVYFFILRCGEVLALYMAYQYSPRLMNVFAQDSTVLNCVTLVGLYDASLVIVMQIALLFFNPIKIARFITTMSLPLYIAIPFFFTNFHSIITIVAIQMLCTTFCITDYPGSPMIYTRFPVLERFKIILLFSGLANAMMWPLCTFGIPFLTNKFGYYGLYIVYLPITIIAIFAINYFVKVTEEKEEPNPSKTRQKNISFQNA